MCALTASREPLPIEFVCKIMNPGGTTLTSLRRVNKAVACISALLPVRDGCLHFFHKSVKDWLTDKSCYGERYFTVDEEKGHEILFNLCVSELDAIKEKGVNDTQFNNTERYALQHGVQHMFEADKLRTFNVTENLMDQYVADLELIYAKLCVNSTVASVDILSALKQVKPALLNDQSRSTLTSLLSLLRKHSYVLREHPHLFFQSLLNEGDPELASEAAKILQMQLSNVPYMEYVDKEDHKASDQARFYCSDAVACFDVSPELDYMVCECRDGTIHLWSLQSGNREWVRPSLSKREFYFGVPFDSAYRQIKNCLSLYRSVVFHPQGKSVLPGTLQQVYTLSGERKDLFPKSDCTFSNCVFSGDKKRILTDCLDDPKRIVLWNMENGENVYDIICEEEIASFTISQDGTLIAISNVSGHIALLDRVKETWFYWRARPYEDWFPLYGGWLDRICGLMHFTSEDNSLVCGFLCLSKEETCADSYRFNFFGRPEFIFFRPHQVAPVVQDNFVLWPCEPRDLTKCDFLKQALSPCWVNNVDRMIPYLVAGSYVRLKDETGLIFSPAHKYVTMVNVGLLNTETDPVTTTRRVKEIAFSLEGDSIYCISEKYFASDEYSSEETEVTVWKMSNRKVKTKKTFLDVVCLITTKKGILIATKCKAAELWNFELSNVIRNLPKLHDAEFKALFAISDALIACWKECRPHCHEFAASDSSQLVDFLELDDSSKLFASPELPGSAKLNGPSKWAASPELPVSAKLDDSAELAASPEVSDSVKSDDSTVLAASLELPDTVKLDDSAELAASPEIPDSVKSDASSVLAASPELPDSVKSDDSAELAASPEVPDSVKLDDSSVLAASPELPDSIKLDESAELAASPELCDSAKLDDSSVLAASLELPDSVKVDDSSELAASPELPDSVKLDDSSELAASPEFPDSVELDDSSELAALPELPDSVKLDDSSELPASLELPDSAKVNDPSTWDDSILEALAKASKKGLLITPLLIGGPIGVVGYESSARNFIEVNIFNVSSGEFESSVKTSAVSDYEGNGKEPRIFVLLVSCSSRHQLLTCTCEEITEYPWHEEIVTLSLWNNNSVIWKRTTTWMFTECENPHIIFSPRDEFVVTWNILDFGYGLQILDTETGETLHVFFKLQKDIVVDCKFVDSETLVCCGKDNFLRLFNVKTGHLLSLLDIGDEPFSLGACLHHPLVAIALEDTKLKFVQVRLPADAKN